MSSITTAPTRPFERVAGDGLQVVADGEPDGAGAVTAGDDVLEVADVLLRGLAGEHRVLGALDLGGAVAERVVAGDAAVQRPERVLALERELTALRVRHRPRDHDTIGRDDLAAWAVELSADRPVVVGVAVELGSPPDLPVVRRREQQHVQRHHPERELADPLVHDALLAATARGRERRSRLAAQRSAIVGSSGISWSRRAVESLSRINNASST